MTTKQEQLRGHYNAIRIAAGAVWGSGSPARVKCIQKHLGAIKKLLEPEPETLASSVLRLTHLCNQLEAENAVLRNDLTGMTLNYNAAEEHARQLKEEAVRKDAELKLELTRKDKYIEILIQDRRECEEKGVTDRACIRTLRTELASRGACLRRVEERLNWLKSSLEMNKS